ILSLVMGKLLILSTNLAFAETSSPVDGEKAFSNCAGCHQVGKDATNAFGPVLTGVVGRKGKYPGLQLQSKFGGG
ncbi:MAG: c-type cytochrome, partial [Methylococcales bacterium]